MSITPQKTPALEARMSAAENYLAVFNSKSKSRMMDMFNNGAMVSYPGRNEKMVAKFFYPTLFENTNDKIILKNVFGGDIDDTMIIHSDFHTHKTNGDQIILNRVDILTFGDALTVSKDKISNVDVIFDTANLG